MSGQQHQSEQLILVNSTCSSPDACSKQLFTCNGRAVMDTGLCKCSRHSHRASAPISVQEAQPVPSSSQEAASQLKKRFCYTLQQQNGMAKAKVTEKKGQARPACKICLPNSCLLGLDSSQKCWRCGQLGRKWKAFNCGDQDQIPAEETPPGRCVLGGNCRQQAQLTTPAISSTAAKWSQPSAPAGVTKAFPLPSLAFLCHVPHLSA